MLAELYQFSRQFQLSPLGYGESLAIYEINLDRNRISLLTTEHKTTNKKGEEKITYSFGKRLMLPDLPRNGDNPILIADAGEYLFGFGERGKRRQELYRALLEQCHLATSEPLVKAVIDYLNQANPEEILEELKHLEYTPKNSALGERDKFVFVYYSQDEDKCLVTNLPSVQKFWAKYFTQKQETIDGECILTGESKPILINTFPGKIKGVPNTQTTGAAISSFDKSAYQSWGWSGNDNAPIGFDTATGILKAVELLLSSDHHHHRLGDQMFLFWGDHNQEGINPQVWNDPEAAQLAGLFTGIDAASPENAINTKDPYSSNFYLGVLKGNSGRVAMNGINRITPQEISANVSRFCELQKYFDNWVKPIWVFRNAAFLDPNKEYTTRIDSALMGFVLLGKELPDEYAQKLLNRICVVQDTFKSQDRAKALLFYTQQPDMDEPKDVIAYRLGRIAFLMHMAQMKGRQQDKEDTNVTRSLKTLSSTPSQIFGRLYPGCYVHHLQALEGMGYLKHLLDQEFVHVNPEDLPDNFNLRQQSLFFIGFAKMRSEFFTKKDKSNPSEQQEQ